MQITREEIQSALAKTKLIADAIKEAGSIPSGHLYAVVMSAFSLSEFEKIVGLLIRADLITKSMNVLTWKGPKDV